MVEVSSCAAISHQLVQHGTADMATNIMDILGDEAFGLVDRSKFTLLHTAVLNVDSAAVLAALLDARSGWDLNAKNSHEETPAALYVAQNDIQALEIVAECGAQLESALVCAGDYGRNDMVDLLLEYSVDRTCFFERKVAHVPEDIVDKVAQAGGLLGLDFAPVDGLERYGLIPKLTLSEKYPCKIGMIRGKEDLMLAHKLTTALQCYGTRMYVLNINHYTKLTSSQHCRHVESS